MRIYVWMPVSDYLDTDRSNMGDWGPEWSDEDDDPFKAKGFCQACFEQVVIESLYPPAPPPKEIPNVPP